MVYSENINENKDLSKMAPRPKLSLDQATALKAEIWNGRSNDEVAHMYGVSIQSVINIKAGRQYYDAPWPSGTQGPMPDMQHAAVANGKRFATKTDWMSGTIWDTSDDKYYQGMEAYRETMDESARDHTCDKCGHKGFKTFADQERHYEEHKREKKAEEERIRLEEYEKRQAIRDKERAEFMAANPDWKPPIKDPHPPIDFTKQDIKYSFEECQLMAPDHVLLHMAENDEYMQKAIQMGFSLWGQSYWNEGNTVLQIKQFRDRIERFENEVQGDNH